MNCRSGGVLLTVALLSSFPVFAVAVPGRQADESKAAPKEEAYAVQGKDAAVEYVLETFLSLASGAYGDTDHDAEFYREFCRHYGIDSSWPSAELLGTAHRRVYDEWSERLAQARKDANYKDLTGRDPNEWLTRALGQAFGEVYEGLARDGLDLSLEEFIVRIEFQNRGSFTRFSSDPPSKEKDERHAQLFWSGAAETSRSAAQYRSEEVDR